MKSSISQGLSDVIIFSDGKDVTRKASRRMLSLLSLLSKLQHVNSNKVVIPIQRPQSIVVELDQLL